MRKEWREYAGLGELLCVVLAWMIGAAAAWHDYASSQRPTTADRVAASSADVSSSLTRE